MNIIILNGPNLNKLGQRKKEYYGSLTLNDIKEKIRSEFPQDSFSFYQSNMEGELVTLIQNSEKDFDGLIINPGGYTHTSIAIKDALEIISIPKIEIHLSNLAGREEYRQQLITTSACDGYVSGFKEYGYLAAIYLLKKFSVR